jgi:uncharacterized protein YdhG (YjbR/CyaY superfamily)
MSSNEPAPSTIGEYVAGFPPSVREVLTRVWETIREAAPGAQESISYRIPAFNLGGPLVYFAAFKSHLGVYPVTPAVRERFAAEVAKYGAGKGTLRFPFDQPVPYQLIGRVVAVRVEENLRRKSGKGRGQSGAPRSSDPPESPS